MKINNKPEVILKLAWQFMESRILLSAAEMNIFSHLDGTPSTAEDLANRLPADLRGLTILLDALTAMGLLSKDKDTYITAADAVLFLTAKSPRSVLPMLHHAAHLWESWSELTAKVKKQCPLTQSRRAHGCIGRSFQTLMHQVLRSR